MVRFAQSSPGPFASLRAAASGLAIANSKIPVYFRRTVKVENWAGRKQKDRHAPDGTKPTRTDQASTGQILVTGQQSKTTGPKGQKDEKIMTKTTQMTTEQIAHLVDQSDPMIERMSQLAALAEEATDPYQKGWLTGIFQFRQQLSILTGRS